MSPIFLALFLGVLLLNFGPRLFRPRSRRRPAFHQNGVLAGRLTEGLFYGLVTNRGHFRSDTHILGVEGAVPVIEREGACGRLILYAALAQGRESDLHGIKEIAIQNAKHTGATLVVVGGSAAFAAAAFRAAAPLRTLHIDDQGALREVRDRFGSPAPRLAVEMALDRMAEGLKDGIFPCLDFESARSLISHDTMSPALTPRVLAPVTFALTSAILLCFAVQVAVSLDSLQGNGASLAIVYRMGGIYREPILAGEWQRLIAAPFLHFGVLHISMNGWAQWSLGMVVETLLGPWRFLILWVGSALGASLTSMAMNDATLAAGASGAIFGLLGAFTAFVFFRKDMLPQPVPRALRNGIGITLLLNLLISFIPGIDMAAHAGGFLTGGALAMFMTRQRHAEPAHRSPALVPTLLVALVVLAGVGKTSIDQHLNQVTRAPGIHGEYRVEEVALPIPAGFVVSRVDSNRLTTVMAESPASPFAVFFRMSPPQPDELSAKKRIDELRPKGGEPAGPGDDVIALSWRGTQNLRAIEVVVQTPASCRAEAERLGEAVVKGIR